VRSLLAVPANNPRFIAKAAQSAADAVFLDLEDAIVPELKEAARDQAVAAINGTDWGGRRIGVRVNELGSAWGEQDLAHLARAAPGLDFVILPKCDAPADVEAADRLLRPSHIRLAALVESARGIANCEAIAGASARMAALVFGPGDYSLDMGILDGTMDTTFAQARVANAARAFGLEPLDGPYFEIANPGGCRSACARAVSLGFAGKMAIHPTQVDIANEAFSPTPAQLAWAREVLEAMAAAGEQGRGAVKTRDGKMIDLVHIKIARRLLERAPTTPTRGALR
jgi:malyl-CoA/(S)-citramalyl-CoA lyase